MIDLLGGLLLVGVVASCGDNEEFGASQTINMKSGYCSLSEPMNEAEFSPWMSKADQQVAYEEREEGMFFAYTEGRNNGGFHQYRHVMKKFTGEKHAEFAVFWGLSASEFYQIDLSMRQKGFVRENLQVFEDGAGKAYHQALWLLPK